MISIPHISGAVKINDAIPNIIPALPLMSQKEADKRWMEFMEKKKDLLKKMKTIN